MRALFVLLRARGPPRGEVSLSGVMWLRKITFAAAWARTARGCASRVSVRLPDGTVSERPLRQVTAGQVVRAGPWRMTRSARGQAHYPGHYWSATSGGHVIYESRLELAPPGRFRP